MARRAKRSKGERARMICALLCVLGLNSVTLLAGPTRAGAGGFVPPDPFSVSTSCHGPLSTPVTGKPKPVLPCGPLKYTCDYPPYVACDGTATITVTTNNWMFFIPWNTSGTLYMTSDRTIANGINLVTRQDFVSSESTYKYSLPGQRVKGGGDFQTSANLSVGRTTSDAGGATVGTITLTLSGERYPCGSQQYPCTGGGG